MAYGYVSLAQAKTDLAQRLADPSGIFWTDAEKAAYLTEALRTRNALTSEWVQDFAFNAPLNPNQIWYNFNTLANSPRARTVTDTDIYKLMEYHLLEPPSGGTWSGTSQFSIADLAGALQRRRDEILQVALSNLSVNTQAASLQRRNLLADTVLELRRVRFVPAIPPLAALFGFFALNPLPAGNYQVVVTSLVNGVPTYAESGTVNLANPQVITTTVPTPYANISWRIYASPDGWATTYVWTFQGPLIAPNTGVDLTTVGATVTSGAPILPQSQSPSNVLQDDTLALEYFDPNSGQMTGTPQSYSLIAEPPLAFDVDYAPNVVGNYELVTLNSGASFAPPGATALGLPDDFSWVAKWGAMADLLGRESEATDRQRAAYCLARYRDGLRLIQSCPWLLQAQVNGIPVDVATLDDMDNYDPEWDSNPNASQVIVTAGIDFLAVSPVPISPQVGISVRVVGNAPVPVQDADKIQVSRDAYDVILDYAQALAMFKMGGQEFTDSAELTKNFIESAKRDNARLEGLGIFRDVLMQDRQAERTEA